jgi:hypothetical protein
VSFVLLFRAWLNSDRLGIGSFVGNFSVPQNPISDPSVCLFLLIILIHFKVLYLFTGLQNVDWIPIVDPTPEVFDIIQPVLQYPADSGYGWR